MKPSQRAVWIIVVIIFIFVSTSKSDTKTLPHQEGHINLPKAKALTVEEKQDIGSYFPNYQQQYQGGPYPVGPYPGGPPPTYGPPPPAPPHGMVRIEFAFDEIVLRCITEEPFDHIVWTRHQCPQQLLYGGEGFHVADGTTVHQEDLYDVHIRGHDGTIISELLIKHPLADNTEGIYQCEVWPHIHVGGGYYNPYQNYNPPKSDVFIIGGNSLLEECYHVGNFGSSSNRPHNGFTHKHSASIDKDIMFKDNLLTIKPRRNTTETRTDGNSKQLRYNLKYVNNSLYNVEGVNVTADFFRPSKNIPLNLLNLHNNITNFSSGLKLLHPFSNLDSFSGRSNDKYKGLLQKYNERQGKEINVSSNTSYSDSIKKGL